MKNFLIITGIYPPDIGGPATFTKDLYDLAIKKKDKVKIITLQDGKNINIKEKNIFKIDRGKNKILRTLLLIRKIRRCSKDVDTILCCGLIFETYISQIGKNNKKIYRFVGDSIWEKYLSSNNPNIFDVKNISIFVKLLIYIRNKILRSFDLIICPSEYLKKYISKKILHNNIKVIRNFANIEDKALLNSKNYKINFNSGKINVVAISRLVKWKNIPYLIKAFKYIEDCNLHIYGSGPEKKLYKNMIFNYSLKNIFLHGSIKRNEILNVIKSSDIFIQISSYEGMSFSILEALSIGKPMILSNIEPNLETAKNAAIYVNPYSIDEIKNAIDILRSKDIRSTLSKNAKIISSKSFNKKISLEGYYNEI